MHVFLANRSFRKTYYITEAFASAAYSQTSVVHTGRQLLAQKTRKYKDGNATRQIRQEMERITLHEAEKAAVRKEIEMRANYGMDGPRPCMQVAFGCLIY
eukprot:scaffold292503_cov48-Prasinocladus_malaysianus.AAC.3